MTAWYLESGYRLDLLVENQVVIELKCVEALLPIHKAQLLTYLRLANKPAGLLLNFNVVHMRDGIRRILNNRYHITSPAKQSGIKVACFSKPLFSSLLAGVSRNFAYF
jgi:hypothetical protein